jgi:hypothetical protein
VAGNWVILQSREYKEWYRTKLTEVERDAIVAVALHLQSEGPSLRRPLSGIIKGSKLPNMKELIPPAGNIRILYVFDPRRQAIFLLGGDKSDNWDAWYKSSILLAEAIYERHLSSSGPTIEDSRSLEHKTGRQKR